MKNHNIQPFTVKLVSSVYEKRILHPEWTVSVYIKKGTGYTIRELEMCIRDRTRGALVAGKTLNMSRRCPPRRAVLFLFNQTKGKRLSV